MSGTNLTAERLRELLHYDPETGVFTWRVRRGMAVAGSVAGNLNRNGYVNIFVDGRQYKAHRLAWLFVYGEFPSADIDHINGVRNDNRIFNLRDVTTSVNMMNQRRARSDNKLGLLGVHVRTPEKPHYKISKPYRAIIYVSGKSVSVGDFATAEEAHAAYLEAKRRLHPTSELAQSVTPAF